ncbi:unnamed protein product [Anisakis simplex]|uniref:Uncharacterized protein n=1 Tax=Anisakis simplex TaxID=6269 RepID=A0A0M3JAE0_ANISI|nr:unnamed protein product [Anisakis simplex]
MHYVHASNEVSTKTRCSISETPQKTGPPGTLPLGRPVELANDANDNLFEITSAHHSSATSESGKLGPVGPDGRESPETRERTTRLPSPKTVDGQVWNPRQHHPTESTRLNSSSDLSENSNSNSRKSNNVTQAQNITEASRDSQDQITKAPREFAVEIVPADKTRVTSVPDSNDKDVQPEPQHFVEASKVSTSEQSTFGDADDGQFISPLSDNREQFSALDDSQRLQELPSDKQSSGDRTDVSVDFLFYHHNS